MIKLSLLTVIFGLFLCTASNAEAIKDGIKKEYYPNGNIKEAIGYKNGKQDGFKGRASAVLERKFSFPGKGDKSIYAG